MDDLFIFKSIMAK
jgi:hypothetical protein